MPTKRAVAISSLRTLQQQMVAVLLAAGATPEAVATVDEMTGARLEADLVLYHAVEAPDPRLLELLKRLRATTPVMVLLGRPSLSGQVNLLALEQIYGVVAIDSGPGQGQGSEGIDAAAVTGAAKRLLFGDVFGVEKYLPWGTRIHSALVGDYREKSAAITAVSDFSAAMGVRRSTREGIEQSLDELLTNALYRAPHESADRADSAAVPTKARISQRMEQKALVQYGCDGRELAVSVRDSFGALRKSTVAGTLARSLAASQAAKRGEPGGGLGLYLVASAANQLAVGVAPGVATEIVCTFDAASQRIGLRTFAFYHERADARWDRRTTDRLQPVPSRSAGWWVAAVEALALAAALAVIVWPIVRRPARGAIVVETEPAGASISVDDQPRGKAGEPLRIDGLALGKAVTVVARLPGYEDAVAIATPAAVEQPAPLDLRLRAETPVARIESEPPGAHLLAGTADSGKLTPVDVTDLRSGESRVYTLRLAGYSDEPVRVTAGAAGTVTNYHVLLPAAAGNGILSVETRPPGATVLLNGVPQAQTTPIRQIVLPAGLTVNVLVRKAGFVTELQPVSVGTGETKILSLTLAAGVSLTVRSSLPARVWLDDAAIGLTPVVGFGVLEGTHRLHLESLTDTPIEADTFVEVRRGQAAEHDFALGTVRAQDGALIQLPPPGGTAAGQRVREVALEAGIQHVHVVNGAGQESEHDITVPAGGTVTVAF